MMSSGSERKRVDGALPEDVFVNPEFERGRKYVSETELEHGAHPTTDQNKSSYPDFNLLEDQISGRLNKIRGYIHQIEDLAREIESQENSIKDMLQKYKA
jgi:hypothetical protein